MLKVIALVRRRADVPAEEFYRVWEHEHPALVNALPGLRRYVQNHAVLAHKGWSWDGAAEMWFDDVAAVRRAFATAEADALREHEEHFIAEVDWFLTEEKPIWPPSRH